MKIAYSKTREQYPLSTKKIIKKTLMGIIGYFVAWCVLSGIGLLFLAATPIWGLAKMSIGTSISLVALIVPCALVYFYQRWYFATYFYDLTADHIVIRKGPITPQEITIPYERVQDVYVDQDLLDRILGLYDVHLSSATMSSGMQAHIDGVESAAANGLRKVLLDEMTKRMRR